MFDWQGLRGERDVLVHDPTSYRMLYRRHISSTQVDEATLWLPSAQNKAWKTASKLPAHESSRPDIVLRPRPDSQHPLSNLFIHPSTSSVLPSCLINAPACSSRSRQGAWRRDKTIISVAAAARAGAPTADRILQHAAVLTQIATLSVPASPRCDTASHYGGGCQTFSLQGTNVL